MIGGWPAADGCSVMAHRGGALVGAANRLPTIARSLDLGAHAVEVDVRVTSDGVPVLFHDDTTQVAGAAVAVASLDLAALQGSAGPITTLRELLELAGSRPFGIYLDLKHLGPMTLSELVDELVNVGCSDRTIVGSFDRDLVRAVVADGRLRASVLYHDPTTDAVELAAELGCTLVHPCFDYLPHMVGELAGPWMDRVRAAGGGVVGWNTNDPALLAEMRSAGFDVLCTDDPASALGGEPGRG